MSSHHEWVCDVVAEHDANTPFAPENGASLKFNVGDEVLYTNDYGVAFPLRITGFYRPTSACSLYARGKRYLVSSCSPWMPVAEASLSRAGA